MKALAAAAPLTGLQHVKRIRKPQSASGAAGKLQILLCPVAAPAAPLSSAAPVRASGPPPSPEPSSGAERPAHPVSSSGGAIEKPLAGDSGEGLVGMDAADALPGKVQLVAAEYGLRPLCVQV